MAKCHPPPSAPFWQPCGVLGAASLLSSLHRAVLNGTCGRDLAETRRPSSSFPTIVQATARAGAHQPQIFALLYSHAPFFFFFTSKFSSSNKSPPGEAGARAALRVCRGCSLQLCNIISPPRQLALPFFFFLLSNRVPSHFFDAAPFFPRCSQPAELLSPTIFLPVQHGAQPQPRTGPIPALPSPCSRPTPKFRDRV